MRMEIGTDFVVGLAEQSKIGYSGWVSIPY